ncbi:hypothetical protein GCM10027161_55090 [Microbispora hainanensis]
MYDNPGRIAKRRQGSRHNQITEYPPRGCPANAARARCLMPASGGGRRTRPPGTADMPPRAGAA